MFDKLACHEPKMFCKRFEAKRVVACCYLLISKQKYFCSCKKKKKKKKKISYLEIEVLEQC